MKRSEILIAGALFLLGALLRFTIAHEWYFAGSDSYGYLSLADEIWSHGRFALSPADSPHLGRMPLYPMFLALVKQGHIATMKGGEGWLRIAPVQILLELLTLPLIFWMAKKLAGAKAGLIALGLAALLPFTPLYCAAILSESLATTLTTLTIATLILGQSRKWPFIGGILVALSTLTRPDGILLSVSFARKKTILLALAGFSLAFAPWIIRNEVQLHGAYVFGGRVDRYTRPMPIYHGWWRWIRSWGRSDSPQAALSTCYYNPPCSLGMENFPDFAFDEGERDRVYQLMALREQGKSVDAEFEELGRERERNHPLRTFVFLPIARAVNMWVSPKNEVLAHPTLWRPMRVIVSRLVLPLMLALSLAILLAIWKLRMRAFVLWAPILARTIILPFAGYSMQRYTVEVIPIACVLIAWAATEWVAEGSSASARTD